MVWLTLGPMFRVTSEVLVHLGQSWRDGEPRPGVKPTRQGEASEAGCQELKAL